MAIITGQYTELLKPGLKHLMKEDVQISYDLATDSFTVKGLQSGTMFKITKEAIEDGWPLYKPSFYYVELPPVIDDPEAFGYVR